MQKLLPVIFATFFILTACHRQDPADTTPGAPGNLQGSFPPPGWLELPEIYNAGRNDFLIHKGTFNGATIRDWSFYWDYGNRISQWVAYPLYKAIYTGALKTDAWGYDLLLPASKQQNVTGGYKVGNNGFYDRGQLIPWLDRATEELNKQTFCGTNTVPMNSDFKGGLWTKLEGKVRSWAGASDTCYVVTGCITEGAKYYVVDRSNNQITVPQAFFKAVLRYEKSSTVGTKGYCAVAFLFDHEEYSQSGKSSLQPNKDMSMSIKDLEDVLGYKLFVNLDTAIGTEDAAAVKADNPRANNWWW